jgi:hypothetical protein
MTRIASVILIGRDYRTKRRRDDGCEGSPLWRKKLGRSHGFIISALNFAIKSKKNSLLAGSALAMPISNSFRTVCKLHCKEQNREKPEQRWEDALDKPTRESAQSNGFGLTHVLKGSDVDQDKSSKE